MSHTYYKYILLHFTKLQSSDDGNRQINIPHNYCKSYNVLWYHFVPQRAIVRHSIVQSSLSQTWEDEVVVTARRL